MGIILLSTKRGSIPYGGVKYFLGKALFEGTDELIR
jgi:hypothetical protein